MSEEPIEKNHLTSIKADRKEFKEGNYYGVAYGRTEKRYVGGYHVIDLDNERELLNLRLFDTGAVAGCWMWVHCSSGTIVAVGKDDHYSSARRPMAIIACLHEVFEIEYLESIEAFDSTFRQAIVDKLLKSAGMVVAATYGIDNPRLMLIKNYA